MDKGVAMVVLDKQDYIIKAQDLLVQWATYRPIVADPTNKHKKQLINALQTIKAEGGIGNKTYKRLYPTGRGPPNSKGYQKSTKRTPFRPIVSSRGAVTYGVAKELANILSHW